VTCKLGLAIGIGDSRMEKLGSGTVWPRKQVGGSTSVSLLPGDFPL